MEKMRVILKQLMEKAGDGPYDLHRKVGVQPSTTLRFLSGVYKEPQTSTVRNWARAYGVTESQLRGDVPIDGIDVPEEPKELKDILPADEYKLLTRIKKLNPEARGVVFGLFELLAEKSEAGNDSSAVYDRRKSVISEKNQHLRASDRMHYSPPRQNQIREHSVAKRTGTRA